VSSVRLLVLGAILKRGTSYGYAVLGDIASWVAEAWTNVKPGSVYHALEKLEAQGMLAAVASDQGVKPGPARREYTVTEKGEAEFMELLEQALVSFDIQQFSAGIAFMHMLTREKLQALLEKRIGALEASARFLEGLPVDEFSPDPSKNPELVGIWAGYVRNEAATTRRILGRVREGKYKFRSETEGE